MRNCQRCHNDFNPNEKTSGLIIHCQDCSDELGDIPKYLGFNDGSLNKSTNTSIYRGDSQEVRKKISNQRARTGGF
jgi:hypothetical protein